ncbi:multidrug ABC transporter ATP-binding protein [Saccharobesus litoralis]|uniref:Multidrug ABC transporter ATP-binding protein n=1 Tax=Saccharobesus litoralis TaxID=2172099 RepID=A0A2S0VN37_9ALTE|nr:ABC transporter ATP-binding protein [Saccharobesus litoralis]AWB65634.1 multidrug ABC transporter ATP-binding protein [Saccharobesus litoralis]
MTNIIQASNLNKHYGKKQVLSNINLSVNAGEIVGVVGSNGAGKSTLLKSLLGLTRVDGDLTVCKLDPHASQHKLMEKVSFIADTATLPKWINAQQLFDYCAQVHPSFRRDLAEAFLSKTNIKPELPVKKMSKGMITQLHLAMVLAIESELLVLDEPTLGLDVLRRKAFYNNLLEDYFDDNNTIVITSHQIEEIEHILTRVVFIDDGKIALDINIDELENTFFQVTIKPEQQQQAELLKPIYCSNTIEGRSYIFQNANQQELQCFGTLKTPSLTDILVALMSNKTTEMEHA